MDKAVELLLYRWGYWMRRSPGIRIGYPSQSIGAWMIHTGEDKSDPMAKRGPYRNANGRREKLRFMSPAPKPKQTKVAKPDIGGDWPDEVAAVDRVIAEMPFAYRQCLLAKYWLELTQIEAAQNLGVSRRYYREYLEKAEIRFESVLQYRQTMVA